MKYWKWLLLLVVLGSAYVGWCYAMFHGHVDPILYPTRGIDISHYQGKVDWDALAEDPRRFRIYESHRGQQLS